MITHVSATKVRQFTRLGINSKYTNRDRIRQLELSVNFRIRNRHRASSPRPGSAELENPTRSAVIVSAMPIPHRCGDCETAIR